MSPLCVVVTDLAAGSATGLFCTQPRREDADDGGKFRVVDRLVDHEYGEEKRTAEHPVCRGHAGRSREFSTFRRAGEDCVDLGAFGCYEHGP